MDFEKVVKEIPTEDLLQELAYRDWHGILVAEELSEMPRQERNEYLKEVRDILRSRVLKNESARLKASAGTSIIRHAKDEVQTAWHRGGMHYIEALGKRLEYLSTVEIKQDP